MKVCAAAAPAATVLAAPLLAAPLLAAVLAATCVPAAGEEFPIRARLYGGPAEYTAGGAPRVFSLDLASTAGSGRRRVHAVLMFIDDRRILLPPQIALEYADGAGHWHAAPFEHTDNDENVAVLGGEDGPGTIVPARGTVTVKLRLRFKPGAPAEGMTASVTVMERKGDDGDWVGESEPYAFRTIPAHRASAEHPAASRGPSSSATQDHPAVPAVPAVPTASAQTGSAATGSAPTGPARSDPASTAPGTKPHGRMPPALAATGAGRSPAGLFATAGALLIVGAVLLRATRPRRRSGGGHG